MAEIRVARVAPLFLLFFLVGCPTPEAEARFAIVLDGLPGALLSVHGTSATDVWTVGGAGEDAVGTSGVGATTAYHWDGTVWTHHDLGLLGIDLWWVHAFDDGTVMMGGEGGTILQRLPGGTFQLMPTPGTGTVFGIWGATSDDVWAVGGLAGSDGFVWHLLGDVWTEVALPATHPGAAVFKVWGTSATDVWFCGLSGTLMRSTDGTTLSMLTSPTTRSLFTLHTDGDSVVAVGGAGSGVLVEREPGGRFADVTPDLAVQMNGVWLTGDGRGWAVGYQSEMMRRTADLTWESYDPMLFIGRDLHAVWVDETGGVWTVGGEILSEPLTDGILLHLGATIGSTIVEE